MTSSLNGVVSNIIRFLSVLSSAYWLLSSSNWCYTLFRPMEHVILRLTFNYSFVKVFKTCINNWLCICLSCPVHSFIPFIFLLLPLEYRASVKHFVSCQFLNLIDKSVGLLGWVITPSQGCYLHRTTQTPMPRVEFKLTTPVFEHAKTVHALDCADTVIGLCHITLTIFLQFWLGFEDLFSTNTCFCISYCCMGMLYQCTDV
jgi:hypothetical protein